MNFCFKNQLLSEFFRVSGRPLSLFEAEDGAVLVFVLWVLALLSVIAGYYSLESRLFKEITAGPWFAVKERMMLESLMKLGVELAISQGEQDSSQEAPDRQAASSVDLNGTPYEVQIGSQQVIFCLEDERGKLDLNRATEEEIRSVIDGLLAENQPDKAKIIVDSILDWRDNNDDRRFNGAEDQYYMGLKPPYHAADRRFLFLDELLLVRGVDLSLFYGPLEFQGRVSAGQGEEAGSKEGWTGGLQDLFTVYNAKGRVLRQAAPVPLTALLEEDSFMEAQGRPEVLRLKARTGRGAFQAFFQPSLEKSTGFRLINMRRLPDWQ